MKQPTVEQCLSLFYRLREVSDPAATLTVEDLAGIQWLVNDHLERERDRQRAQKRTEEGAELESLSAFRSAAKKAGFKA